MRNRSNDFAFDELQETIWFQPGQVFAHLNLIFLQERFNQTMRYVPCLDNLSHGQLCRRQ